MIKFENVEVQGWEAAIRGMRNATNSWCKSDSAWLDSKLLFTIGDGDLKLMDKLAKSGSVHAKYRRMITVYVDIIAPLYWWKEFDTYKVGTVANSCSTMHKIHVKELTLDDFSHGHLYPDSVDLLESIINELNYYRNLYINGENGLGDKEDWWQMIQLLPSSYNQRRTVMMNYEVLANIYEYRRGHKLDEWRDFCDWIEHKLPYSEIITAGTLEDY